MVSNDRHSYLFAIAIHILSFAQPKWRTPERQRGKFVCTLWQLRQSSVLLLMRQGFRRDNLRELPSRLPPEFDFPQVGVCTLWQLRQSSVLLLMRQGFRGDNLRELPSRVPPEFGSAQVGMRGMRRLRPWQILQLVLHIFFRFDL
jgi:hypothetical protein